MILLGINLLDIFPWVARLQPTMPKFIARSVLRTNRLSRTVGPLVLGMATFFLPCGFTQSMQMYALKTGSFLTGGLTMLVFALGTLPVLGLISFGSFTILKGRHAGVFFKAAGVVVIAFGFLNLMNSLAAAGMIRPLNLF
jgi:sulfite exporter TauE/SafE